VVSLSISAATNWSTTGGFAYDAAGNLVQWPGGTVTMGAEYDVDGRLSVVRWDGVVRERYYYDARNLRVVGGGSYQVYGLGGELLGEYEAAAGSVVPRLWRGRVYFAGRLVATLHNYGWEASNTDRLGSVRAARRYPFGEGNNADNDGFATYRKDTTAQHDYAWHRFYSATWGRFSSPDPYVMSGGLTNPQGWNRYSYVANDPVNYYDPQGLLMSVPLPRPGMPRDQSLGGCDELDMVTLSPIQRLARAIDAVEDGLVDWVRPHPEGDYAVQVDADLYELFSAQFAAANPIPAALEAPAPPLVKVLLVTGAVLYALADWWESRRNRTSCTVKCQLIDMRQGLDNAIGYITETGTGTTYREACLEAKRRIDVLIELQYGKGFRKRHCQERQ
jgi:RHS repeat-associated protein